jgi:hypothetical protein
MSNRNSAGNGPEGSSLCKEPPTPSQSGSGGVPLQAESGGEDEAKTTQGGDPAPTRATKQDKVQPRVATRGERMRGGLIKMRDPPRHEGLTRHPVAPGAGAGAGAASRDRSSSTTGHPPCC